MTTLDTFSQAQKDYKYLIAKQSALPYLEQVKLSEKGMGLLWPKIRELEAELDLLKQLHTMFQAIHYEAERHCVDITHLLPSDKRKKKSEIDLLLEDIKKLPPQKIKLLKKKLSL